MRIESTAFKEGEGIPVRYTCNGEDVRPPLSFRDVPKEARALALIVDDPDSPSGTWTHWSVWDIAPDTRGITEKETPPGTEGMTTFGATGYGGPCPHKGTHRYFFTLYALHTPLLLPHGASVEEVRTAIKRHSIAEASLMGHYARA